MDYRCRCIVCNTKTRYRSWTRGMCAACSLQYEAVQAQKLSAEEKYVPLSRRAAEMRAASKPTPPQPRPRPHENSDTDERAIKFLCVLAAITLIPYTIWRAAQGVFFVYAVLELWLSLMACLVAVLVTFWVCNALKSRALQALSLFPASLGMFWWSYTCHPTMIAPHLDAVALGGVVMFVQSVFSFFAIEPVSETPPPAVASPIPIYKTSGKLACLICEAAFPGPVSPTQGCPRCNCHSCIVGEDEYVNVHKRWLAGYLGVTIDEVPDPHLKVKVGYPYG